ILRSAARGTAEAPGSSMRRLLLAADVALAVVLLAGAGLMIRSVSRLLAADPGFDPERVTTFQAAFLGPAYAEDAVVRTRPEALARGLRAIPGVEAAGAASQIPLSGNGDSSGFHIQGRMAANPAEAPSAERYSVTPDYFALMRIPLRAGRLFTD